MNFEELKRLWQCQKLDVTAELSPGEQIELMRRKMKRLDRALRWADAMTIGIAVGCILWFAWTFLKTPLRVARIGLLITIASLAFWIWEPIRARRRSPQPPTDASVTQWLRHELEKVRAQSELKRTRLWSVLVFWIGGMVFTWGLDTGLSSRIFFSAVLTGINVLLAVSMWKLNQYTWRKADLPLIEELQSLLQSNTPNNPTDGAKPGGN